MANYTIDGKTVIANVAKLSEKELTAVKNYLALGYSLVEAKKEKKAANPDFKQEAIQKFLEEHGSKKQRDDYWKRFNAPVEKDGKIVLKKDGTPKKKGHVATLAWFKKEFPKYPEQK